MGGPSPRASWSDSVRAGLPSAWELGLTPVIGAALAALLDALAIPIVCGWPDDLGLRLAHHAFAASETIALGAWLGFLPAAAAVAAQIWRPLATGPARALGWAPVLAASTAAMHWIVGDTLRRQADAFLEGAFAAALFPALVGASGLLPVVAQLLGSLAARVSDSAASATSAFALGALASHHFVLRDDYPGVHTAIVWVAMTLFGASVAARGLRWFGSRRALVAGLIGVAAVAVVVEPANAVRLQLFRECGAVAPWVLARVVWRLPATDRVDPPRGTIASATRPPLVAAPVVVLVTVDALRADVFADGRYDARLPHLARLRDEALYFPRAVAPGAQTSVSLAAMFSGRSFSEQRWEPYGSGSARFLYPARDRALRFPEVIARAGIGTHGFLGLKFLTGDFGVTRGLGDERLIATGRSHAPAEQLMMPLLAEIDGLDARTPGFFFVHLTEPHEPYDRGKLTQGPAFERYLSEIEVVDHWIGRLMQRMRARMARRGYLLVSSDHGEAFGEHGTFFHTKTIYDELLRVPLFVWGARVRPLRCDNPAALVDLGPTALDIFGLAHDEGSLGQTLLPIALGEQACDSRQKPIVAEGRLRYAFYARNGLKVIEDRVRKTVEVYDTSRDPGELDNLFDRDRRGAQALAELRAFFASRALEGYEPPFKP